MIVLIEDFLFGINVNAQSNNDRNEIDVESGADKAEPKYSEETKLMNSHSITTQYTTVESNKSLFRYVRNNNRTLLLRAFHSILTGVNYGLALLMMLIAMTYNPSLFLALVSGYSVGDFLFFSKSKNSVNECH